MNNDFKDCLAATGKTTKGASTEVADGLTARGSVRKILRDKTTGEIVYDHEDHNLIVKTGRSALVNILAGKLTSSVTKMAVGNGGTADLTTNAFNPIPPADNNTNLSAKIHTVTLSSREVDTSQSNPKATFVALFDCAAVNNLVNECGLFMTDGTTMFARHTFDTVSLKSTSNFSLEISWTIEF